MVLMYFLVRIVLKCRTRRVTAGGFALALNLIFAFKKNSPFVDWNLQLYTTAINLRQVSGHRL